MDFDWKMISVVLSLFQFIFMAVIFAVLKFNDMKHIDIDLQDLKKSFHENEKKQDERHIENLQASAKLSESIATINERCKAINKIRE